MLLQLSEDGVPVVLVDLDGQAVPDGRAPLGTDVPLIIVGLSHASNPERQPAAAWCDTVVAPNSPEVDAIVETVERWPIASRAMAVLLRGAEVRSLDDGLLAESATYSALQAGSEFAEWRTRRPPRLRSLERDVLAVERIGERLHITLNRPRHGNALNVALRDQLVEALRVPLVDPTVTGVDLRGAGRDFSTGGDLDEFGTFPDPATAHLVRLGRSPARGVAQIGHLVTAHLHGACVGSGIELAAFAARVVARPDMYAQLPELSLGLVPGAGGTVSITRRIGRHRTMRMALTRERIPAELALEWGLIDEIEPYLRTS